MNFSQNITGSLIIACCIIVVWIVVIVLDKVTYYFVNRPNARIVHRIDGFVPQYRKRFGILWYYFENSFGNIEKFEKQLDAQIFIETYFSSIEITNKKQENLQPTKYFRI